jgi:hypothetical protein
VRIRSAANLNGELISKEGYLNNYDFNISHSIQRPQLVAYLCYHSSLHVQEENNPLHEEWTTQFKYLAKAPTSENSRNAKAYRILVRCGGFLLRRAFGEKGSPSICNLTEDREEEAESTKRCFQVMVRDHGESVRESRATSPGGERQLASRTSNPGHFRQTFRNILSEGDAKIRYHYIIAI